MKNNIILIGMPSVGKSTIGRDLALKINYTYLDTDALIVENIKMELPQFIALHGVREFKKIETKILLSINCTNCVIATGGSVVYDSNVMSHLKSLGKIIYLKNSFLEIEKRILAAPDRGLVIEQHQSLMDLYLERIELYCKYANEIVVCENLDVDTVSQRIIKVMK